MNRKNRLLNTISIDLLEKVVKFVHKIIGLLGNNEKHIVVFDDQLIIFCILILILQISFELLLNVRGALFDRFLNHWNILSILHLKNGDFISFYIHHWHSDCKLL